MACINYRMGGIKILIADSQVKRQSSRQASVVLEMNQKYPHIKTEDWNYPAHGCILVPDKMLRHKESIFADIARNCRHKKKARARSEAVMLILSLSF